MKLPPKVVVGFRTYAISTLDPRKEINDDIEGWCRNYKATIEVRTQDRMPFEIANTLLHEIMHACWNVMDLEDPAPEETAVTKLTNQLAQVFRDNPTVADFILRNSRA